ncbi:hypothetical protein Leryth_022994 [Lithospermum erythrorhizon]|nr:hypothetical protein Leryth_022994 [Lithospermum erythrorhizon]
MLPIFKVLHEVLHNKKVFHSCYLCTRQFSIIKSVTCSIT